MDENIVYYGDNLDVLRRHIKDESVDLIYLDPPFKSNQDYNVLFAEQDGSRAAAQIKAFEDTWRWDRVAASAYQEVVERGGKVSQAMQAFRLLLGDSDTLAYLAMMALRIVELQRLVKARGHCSRPVLRLWNGHSRRSAAEPALDRDRHHSPGGDPDKTQIAGHIRRHGCLQGRW